MMVDHEGGEESHPKSKKRSDHGPCTLRRIHSLGVRSSRDVPSPVHFLGKDVLLFISGRHLILHHIVRRCQVFLSSSSTALHFTTHRPTGHIAVFEEVDTLCQLHIQKLSLDQVRFSDEGSDEGFAVRHVCHLEWTAGRMSVQAMAFSHNAKYLGATLDDGTLMLWDAQEGTIQHSCQVSHDGFDVIFAPAAEDADIAVCGGGKLSILRSSGDGMVAVNTGNSALSSCQITSCVWLDPVTLVIGTSSGCSMLVSRQLEIKQTIPGHRAVHALCCFGDRFVCAGAGGRLAIFRYHSADKPAEAMQTLVTPEGQDIVGVQADPTHTYLVLVHNGADCSRLNLPGPEAAPAFLDCTGSAYTSLDVGFHLASVTAVDVCIQRPFVLTASTDCHLRIWNFQNSCMELKKNFDEDIFSLACHPTGLFLIAGFRYRLALLYLLQGPPDVSVLQEWSVSCCRCIRFSNGGQFFAAASVNRIYIFDTYTFECITSLQGQEDLITSLRFGDDDHGLVSGAHDGCLMHWPIADTPKVSVMHVESGSVEAVEFCGPDGFVCIANVRTQLDVGGSSAMVDTHLHYFERGQLLCSIPIGQTTADFSYSPRTSPTAHLLPYDCRVYKSTLAVCHAARTLFVGTPQGTIQSFQLPLSIEANQVAIHEYAMHTGPVIHLQLSSDNRLLFSIGQDGTLLTLRLQRNTQGLNQPWPKPLKYNVYNSLTTVLKAPGKRFSETSEDSAVQSEVLSASYCSASSANGGMKGLTPLYTPSSAPLKLSAEWEPSESGSELVDDISDGEWTHDLESMKQELLRIKLLLKKGDAKKNKLRMAVKELQKQVKESGRSTQLPRQLVSPSNAVETMKDITIALPVETSMTSSSSQSMQPTDSTLLSPRTPPRAKASPMPVRLSSTPMPLPNAMSPRAEGNPKDTWVRRRASADRRIDETPSITRPLRRSDSGPVGRQTRSNSTGSNSVSRATTPPPSRPWLPLGWNVVPYGTYAQYSRKTTMHSPYATRAAEARRSSSTSSPRLRSTAVAQSGSQPKPSATPRPVLLSSSSKKSPSVKETSPIPLLPGFSSKTHSRGADKVLSGLSTPTSRPKVQSARTPPVSSPPVKQPPRARSAKTKRERLQPPR